jgi:hypothetical protein
MKRRFILYRRKLGGMFYVEDPETRKQESLGTKNRAEAMSLLNEGKGMGRAVFSHERMAYFQVLKGSFGNVRKTETHAV